MSLKTKLLIAFGIIVAVGGYFMFDSIYGAGMGLIGLIFGQKKPAILDGLEAKEVALEGELEGLEAELGEDVSHLDLDGEADHWND